MKNFTPLTWISGKTFQILTNRFHLPSFLSPSSLSWLWIMTGWFLLLLLLPWINFHESFPIRCSWFSWIWDDCKSLLLSLLILLRDWFHWSVEMTILPLFSPILAAWQLRRSGNRPRWSGYALNQFPVLIYSPIRTCGKEIIIQR